jgi:hypothetical protein
VTSAVESGKLINVIKIRSAILKISRGQTDMAKVIGAFLQGLVAKTLTIVLRLVHTFRTALTSQYFLLHIIVNVPLCFSSKAVYIQDVHM